MSDSERRGRVRQGHQAGAGRRIAPATPEVLEKAALRYLERYAAPAAHLRRVLMARVERSAWAHGTDRSAGAEAVDALVERLVRGGVVDDAAFAESRALSLHRRGVSARAIRARLRAKGVEDGLVERALARLEEEAAAPELAAALAYARRRGLGPYRPTAEREAHRDRDMTVLGRRGFDYGLARRVVDAPDAEDLEREAQGEA